MKHYKNVIKNAETEIKSSKHTSCNEEKEIKTFEKLNFEKLLRLNHFPLSFSQHVFVAADNFIYFY